jgi:hypothetical protein
MNSSAIASYSESGVCTAKALASGQQVTAAIKAQARNLLGRNINTAAEL